MTEFTEKDLERKMAEIVMEEWKVLDKRLAQVPSRKVSPEFDRKMKRLLGRLL